MFDVLDAESIARLGGVAWAKRFAAQLRPGRLDELLDFWRLVERFAGVLQDRYCKVRQRSGSWEGRAATAADAETGRAIELSAESLDLVRAIIVQLEEAREGVYLTLGRIRELEDELPGDGPANVARRARAAECVNGLSACYVAVAGAFDAMADAFAVPNLYGGDLFAPHSVDHAPTAAGAEGGADTSLADTLPLGTTLASLGVVDAWTLSVFGEVAEPTSSAAEHGLGVFGEAGLADRPQEPSAPADAWVPPPALFSEQPGRRDGSQRDFTRGLFGDEGFASG